MDAVTRLLPRVDAVFQLDLVAGALLRLTALGAVVVLTMVVWGWSRPGVRDRLALVAQGAILLLPVGALLPALHVPVRVGSAFNRVDNPDPGAFQWLLFVWGAGTLLLLLRLAVGALRLRAIKRQSQAVSDARISTVVDRVQSEMGLVARVRVRTSARFDVPVTFGARRPVILLPPAARSWSDDCLRSVVRHEMAHMKRGDWARQLGTNLLCALYWFHPLLWWLRGRQERDAEFVCDAMALQGETDRRAYARHLLEVTASGGATSSDQATALPFVTRPVLEQRVRAVLRPPSPGQPPRRVPLLLGLVCVVALALTPVLICGPS